MPLVNLTPHDIKIIKADGKEQNIFCHFVNGKRLVLRAINEPCKNIAGVKQYKLSVGLFLIDSDGNKEPYKEDTLPRLHTTHKGKVVFLVSAMALQAVKGRFMGSVCVAPCKFIRLNGEIVAARGVISY
jgi:hypothetical protein